MIVRTLDRVRAKVDEVLQSVVADEEYVEWDASILSEPTIVSNNGEASIEVDSYVVIFLSVKEPEDGLTLNARVGIALLHAIDENIETLVLDTWQAIQVERMESQFSE